MLRTIQSDLISWQNSYERRPMLLRGARQVGKSFTVRQFGKQSFKNIVEVNFEGRPELKELFRELDPARILLEITDIS